MSSARLAVPPRLTSSARLTDLLLTTNSALGAGLSHIAEKYPFSTMKSVIEPVKTQTHPTAGSSGWFLAIFAKEKATAA
jgi:hypothetical protein